ncbi:hypothetical protein RJ40_02755 [Methanofollis aquaemaris]|uniref:Uncharacterized protein n=1 Tax=Methanofollis aquaemaris TaxID=126734 RepID=A0A8A3S4E9_9EURY|nr:hypothetical protein [Methanofollis aquaemaris]QSZ66494.1 hypothetical protein RJ40_02755 [Methanofollis aquaemaris]
MSPEPDPIKSISIPVIMLICLCLTCGCFTSQSFSVPPNAFGLPLLDIWNESVALSGIDERTADLSDLYIFIKDNGGIESMNLAFSGEKDGKIQRYRVDMNGEGLFTLRSTGTLDPDMDPIKVRPRPLLRELEMIDYREFIGDLPPGTCMLNVRLHDGVGASFDERNVCIMSLENGTFSPLKRVIQPASYLTICKMYRTDHENGTSYSSDVGPEGERTYIFAFTPDQLTGVSVECPEYPQEDTEGPCRPLIPSAGGTSGGGSSR